MSTSTGILYFSLAPKQDAKHKKWTASDRRNTALSTVLYKSTKKKLLRFGLDVLETISGKSSSKSFGNNLADAIEESFNKGYEQLIIVGNDCPQLIQEDLRQSLIALNQDHLSMGKTPKGGAYIFSIKKSAWNKTKFAQLSWCTNQLATDLQNYLSAFKTVIQLQSKDDLNDLQDLYQYIGSHRTIIAMLICSLMADLPIQTFRNPLKSNHTINKYYDRGPPMTV